MSDFQITIVPPTPIGDSAAEELERFGTRQHSGGASKIIERIDELEEIWDTVIKKLTSLAAKSQITAAVSSYDLNSIQFNVGIEAGLSVGLVTKADASISITFTRKNEGN